MTNMEKLGVVRFHGMLGDKDVSAVAFWNQRALVVADEITGQGNVVQLFETNGDEGAAKAEGLAIIEETSHHWKILVVFDGLKDGHATRYRVKKP